MKSENRLLSCYSYLNSNLHFWTLFEKKTNANANCKNKKKRTSLGYCQIIELIIVTLEKWCSKYSDTTMAKRRTWLCVLIAQALKLYTYVCMYVYQQ